MNSISGLSGYGYTNNVYSTQNKTNTTNTTAQTTAQKPDGDGDHGHENTASQGSTISIKA